MSVCCQRSLRNFVIFMLSAISVFDIYGHCKEDSLDRGRSALTIAIKSNLIHDVMLTPDIGVELVVSPAISVGIEGICAWWSNNRAHRYWRIRGLWLDASWWFGESSRRHRFTGHHAGIYTSIHDFDFEFGGRGWQSDRPALGVGFAYGYSFRLNRHLNLDLSVRAGYAGVSMTEYRPMCGTYTCIRHRNNHYFGPTGLGVSLVWVP